MTLAGLFWGWLLSRLAQAEAATAPAPEYHRPAPRRPARRRRVRPVHHVPVHRPPVHHVPVVHRAPVVHRPAPAPRKAVPHIVPVAHTAPWPQVVPSGLPAFPSSSWEPDEPPPGAVVARAAQLLAELWRGGEGTFKVERTGARWIAYRAVKMGTKKGVVAYRLKPTAQVAPAPAPAPVHHDAVPVVYHRTAPAPAPAPPISAVRLPTLRQGSRGEDVKLIQRHVGAKPDGIFGPMTRSKVVAFQSSHGLVPDGIVGPKTWAKLLG